MAFSDTLRLRVKKRAHFCCCLCRDLYVEVHHIVPQEDDGPDTEDNAAPLCPSCHEKFGGNESKRKFIREARDYWYELCAERYKAVDPDQVVRIHEMLSNTATKADVEAAFAKIVSLVKAQMSPPEVSVDNARQLVAHVTSSVLTSVATVPVFGVAALGYVGQVQGSAAVSAPQSTIAESKTPLR